jgi:hypothetical protein
VTATHGLSYEPTAADDANQCSGAAGRLGFRVTLAAILVEMTERFDRYRDSKMGAD